MCALVVVLVLLLHGEFSTVWSTDGLILEIRIRSRVPRAANV